MKKIVLLFNLIATFLFSFSFLNIEEKPLIEASVLSQTSCDVFDSVVTVTTVNKLIEGSGVIIDSDNEAIYIATSYEYFKDTYKYEIVFNDYTREKASVVGHSKEDQVLLLKVYNSTANYCVANRAKSSYLDLNEELYVLGKNNFHSALANAIVSSIGVCRNCQEETYKTYFYTVLQSDVSSSLIGGGAFDKNGALMGLVTGFDKRFKMSVQMLDITKLYAICFNLINYGKYEKNYIKYNLLDVNSLTNHEKYLYSLDEGITSGVLVSSIHYLNYIIGGMNQGMVILKVNDVSVDNCYELDNELSRYKKGARVDLLVKTLSNKTKVYRIKL